MAQKVEREAHTNKKNPLVSIGTNVTLTLLVLQGKTDGTQTLESPNTPLPKQGQKKDLLNSNAPCF